VVQGESSLGQRPGNVTGEGAERVTGAQRPTVAIHHPGHGIGEFFALGDRPQRAEVWRFVKLGEIVDEALPDLPQTVV
jgi:hypothetical protein